jgi:glucokinase
MKNLHLAGDVGGTKTVLALYSSEQGPNRPVEEATFASIKFRSLEEVIQAFLMGKNVRIAGASIGVAGPVRRNLAHVTNLPWVVDASALSQAIGGSPAHLLNDLEAIAYAVSSLAPSDLVTLNPGEPEEHGALGVIAPGTGLGESFLVWIGNHYVPQASEGGHSNFAPSTLLEVELLRFLMHRFDHISHERVCSGMGLPNLYVFLRDTAQFPEPDLLRERLAHAPDPTPLIIQAAIVDKMEICVETLNLFVSILGSEAGNLALKVMATGGLYLGGGIPPRILPYLKQAAFLRAITNKGRFAEMLSKIPVHVILHPQAGLFGAACHALELAR